MGRTEDCRVFFYNKTKRDAQASGCWFLITFLELDETPPRISEPLAVISKLHRDSVLPTGMFGFHITTFCGPPPMIVDWTDNCGGVLDPMLGEDPELLKLAEEFIKKVVPRLLQPLQTGGRNIKPSLCHRDLWDGNIQMDFQCMRSPRYKVGPDFVRVYRNQIGASELTADFDDRNALYAVRNNIIVAGMWPRWAHLLETSNEEIRRLIAKHPKGLAGFEGDLAPTVKSKVNAKL
ncbi:hypothetical protein C8A05DRAFT_42722 [Staphylotrichum tortipilum]|uniref:Protein-ribulosamine 3-kinase n=1 Tax=Staphylotrichum tortipilum TaxID=2831512 RepID=A0AAN6MNI3_9PEZI|nr:hypothetical protein C8A05DRAFT_42722 [Staphylotrichum longicolle]